MNFIKYFILIISILITNILSAATITVTNDNNDSAGSLRQAIFDANFGDTIDFAADYTIVLNNELFIDKDLTIDGINQNITISGNNSVRVFNIFLATVNLSYLTITQGQGFDGGGIFINGGTVTIENSTILNNSAMDGGGIYSMGTLQIMNSTFANNSATNFGGGLYDMSMSAAISNSTFSGNSAITDGGGIYAMTSFPLMNTIIANSTGGDCVGILVGDNTKTIIEDGSCDPTINSDPLLGPLQNNGGPTKTFALSASSPAIDAGDNSYCSSRLDQRGFNGEQNGTCDIGAYESVNVCLSQTQIPQAECETLVAIYDSTNGISWGGNWTITNTPCDDWGGITCSGGNITEINRSGQGLTGELPDLSALISLYTLDLNNNSLTGSFPNISALTNLKWFYISNNNLTGSIPDLSNLSDLLAVNLSDNKLSGSIPNFSSSNSGLVFFEVEGNQLTGTIPNLSNLTSLMKLKLNDNKLEGTIPSLSASSNLKWLNLRNNQLTGTIPDLSSLPLIAGLTDLSYNAFTAEIGTSATNEQLTWKDTQNIAPVLSTTTVLSETSIQINWTPIAYTEDTGHYQVKYSTTSGGPYTNAVSKTTDKSIDNYTVTGLDLGTTYYFKVETFTANHGDQQSNLTSIESVEVSATTTGTINCAAQTDIPEAECDTLVDLYTSTDGANWSDSPPFVPANNWGITTTPCSWTGIACSGGNVTKISRDTQNLVGTIPDLSVLTGLTVLKLDDNQLTGSIPDLSDLTGLTVIRLGNNQLTGSIPDLSALISLETLSLKNNQLTGSIPNLSNSINLQLLRLRDNQLTGIIPNLSALTALKILSLKDNQLTGSIPDLSNLTSLKELTLQDNQLIGSIPDLSNLTSLTELTLQNNQLSGTIPDLPASLTVTDLSYNAFNGETNGSATAKDPDWANTQTVPPTAGLSGASLSDTSIKVDWTPITYQVDGGYYEVKYSTTPGGPYSTSGGIIANKTANTLTVNGLLAGTTYYFVTETTTLAHGTQQSDVTSLPSIEISATTTGSALSNLIATVVSDTQINLSWTDSSTNETGFKITINGSLITTTTANVTSYSNTNLTCSSTYTYSIAATNGSIDSATITATATTLACPSDQPTVYHKLIVKKVGNGTIFADYGINCGTVCEHDFADQTEISLTATPDSDWLFIGWTGDCDKDGLVRINKDKTCIATFESNIQSSVTHKLIVEKIGEGTITFDYGINCGNDCEQDFADQTEVNLIATPDTYWLFSGWTGDCDTEGLVRLHKDKTCIATFESTVQPVDIIPVDNADTPIDTTDNNPVNIPITDVPITDVIDNTTDIPTDIPTDTTDSVDNSNELEIDGNGDGILDSEQIYVITIPDAITGKYLTLESHIGCPIKIASAHIEEEQAFESEDYSFPQGIIYYELQCKKANITMYFHGMSRFRMKPVYKKFGSLIPGDLSTLSWYTLPNVIFNIETVNGKPVATAKFTLIDGELGDNTGVDGRIVDPGGIGFEN